MKKALYLLLLLISQLSQTNALQYGKYYSPDLNIDIRDYYVSEKLDGFRGYWNGKDLVSKSGYSYNPPKWFTEHLGDKPLDGELWIARGKFEQLIPILNSSNYQDDWQLVKFMIFDMPAEQQPFSERVKYMESYIPSLGLSHVEMIPQQALDSLTDLQKLLDKVEIQGGEGLMLHRKDALYGQGRVDHLLKLKKHDEGEGKVIGYSTGKGKYIGQVGSLILQLEDGSIVKVGSGLSDKLRKTPPKIGEVVVFIYNGLTRYGKPKFARFKRVKHQNIE